MEINKQTSTGSREEAFNGSDGDKYAAFGNDYFVIIPF